MQVWLLNASEQLAHIGSQHRRMRTGLLAKALLDRGHRVTWWKSTFEHVSKQHLRKTDGFDEVEPGLTIGWIHSRGYRKHVSLARAVDHWEIGRRFPALAKGRRLPHVMVCSLPVPDLAAAGVRFAEQHGVPAVTDIRDWWPDALVYTLPRFTWPLALRLLAPYARLSREACRGATAITGITPAFVDWGLSRARRSRTELDRDFPHGYEASNISDADGEAARRYWDDLGVCADGSRVNIAFIGSVSRTFDFTPVFAAARALSGSDPGMTFVVCGDGDQLATVRREAGGLSNVVFTGTWVGPAEIQELLRRTAVGLAPLPNRPDFIATMNNKTVEYLSAGVPIIVSPEKSWVGLLATRHGFGVCWDGRDPRQLVQAIERLTADNESLSLMAERAGSYFRDHFDASAVYSRFAEHLENIARRHENLTERNAGGLR